MRVIPCHYGQGCGSGLRFIEHGSGPSENPKRVSLLFFSKIRLKYLHMHISLLIILQNSITFLKWFKTIQFRQFLSKEYILNCIKKSIKIFFHSMIFLPLFDVIESESVWFPNPIKKESDEAESGSATLSNTVYHNWIGSSDHFLHTLPLAEYIYRIFDDSITTIRE